MQASKHSDVRLMVSVSQDTNMNPMLGKLMPLICVPAIERREKSSLMC